MNIRTALRYLATTIIIIFIFLSCSSDNEATSLDEVYPLDLNESVNPVNSPEDWIGEMEFIKLETKKECYLGSNMFFDVSNTHIAVCSSNTIHIFDKKGKHINSFNRNGKGPGEYVQIYKIRLMPNTDEVMISDPNGKKIIVYDFDGKTTADISLKFMMLDVVPVKKDLFACHIGRMSRAYVKETDPDFKEESSLHEMVYINRNGEQVSEYKPFKYTFAGSFVSGNFTGPENAGQFYINPAYGYDVYQVGPGDKFEIKYRFDYLDHSMDTSLLNNKKFMQSSKANSNIKGYTKLDHLSMNKNSIMIWAPNISENINGFRLINRKSGKQKSIFINFMQSFGNYHGIPIDFGRNTLGEWFIQKSEAFDMLLSFDKMSNDQKAFLSKSKGFNKLGSLKPDDNPVLVFYKVKDF